jgi:hypothetical protein
VSWATFWANAKEHWRARVFIVGAIFVAAGGYALYSDVRHQIHGKPATATLMEHIKHCTAEYQRIGEEEAKGAMVLRAGRGIPAARGVG